MVETLAVSVQMVASAPVPLQLLYLAPLTPLLLLAFPLLLPAVLGLQTKR